VINKPFSLVQALCQYGRGSPDEQYSELGCRVGYCRAHATHPVIVFLMVIAAEVLIDFVIEARMAAVCIAAAGAISWFVFHKRSPRPGIAIRSGSEEETGTTAIAAPPR
jgi:hypothetical protein